MDNPYPRVPGLGGARPNAGRKKRNPDGSLKEGGAPRDSVDDMFGLDESSESAYSKYEKARAEKEYHLARQAAIKADFEEGRVVQRAAVQTACARAFATISQSLDAIPDVLERTLGISPETAEAVGDIIAASKGQLMKDLELAYRTNVATANDT